MNEVYFVGTAIAGLVVFCLNLIAIIIAIYKLGRAVEKFEQIGTRQADEISGLKNEVKVVGDLVTRSALQNQRLDNLSSRMGRIEQLIEDIRRGEGFILPLSKSHNEVS